MLLSEQFECGQPEIKYICLLLYADLQWASLEYVLAVVLQVIQIPRNQSSAHLKETNTARETKSRHHVNLFAEKASTKKMCLIYHNQGPAMYSHFTPDNLTEDKLKVRSVQFHTDGSACLSVSCLSPSSLPPPFCL